MLKGAGQRASAHSRRTGSRRAILRVWLITSRGGPDALPAMPGNAMQSTHQTRSCTLGAVSIVAQVLALKSRPFGPLGKCREGG